jgi:hypothetical protein
MRVRYIAPIIPPLAILSVFGLRNILAVAAKGRFAFIKTTGMALIAIGISLLIGTNATYIWDLYQRVDPISYISGKLGRDEYIEKYRPEYAVLKLANRSLEDNAKIFCLFLGNRGYYSDREMFFGDSYFQHAVKGANSAEEILKYFKEKNFTHLLIRFDLFNNWSIHQFDINQRRILGQFFKKHTNRLIAKGGYGLYRLDR